MACCCEELDEEENLYTNAAKYWCSVEPTVSGMLGGLAQVSKIDIRASNRFIGVHVSESHMNTDLALDCGSGIGRVTKHVLLKHFARVDMIDVISQFLEQSKEYLGSELNARVRRRLNCGLQDYQISPCTYDLIWCQWVLGQLNDSDLVEFLKRCKGSLTPRGLIVIKENVCSSEVADWDERDSSWTRPLSTFYAIFEEAGLKILSQKWQTGFPSGLYRVKFFALQPKTDDIQIGQD